MNSGTIDLQQRGVQSTSTRATTICCNPKVSSVLLSSNTKDEVLNNMPKAPFSLHCIICFDAFNLTDRPPVVLPCGHTYVCLGCSKRLKRCMECREPLYMTVPSNIKALPTKRASSPMMPGSPSFRARGGDVASYSSRFPSPRFSPTPPSPGAVAAANTTSSDSQIPLPVAKNLVLMSLMETSERAYRGEQGLDKQGGYESGDDDEQVLQGMELLTSGYGTYVVRERNGLLVYPNNHSPPFHAGENGVPLMQSSSLFDGNLDGVLMEEDPAQFGRSSPLEISYSVSSDDDEEAENENEQEGFMDGSSQKTNQPQAPKDTLEGVIDGSMQETSEPSTPKDEPSEEEESEIQYEVDNVGNVESAFRKVTPANSPNEKSNAGDTPLSTTMPPPMIRLEFGQTVQVVSFTDGIAKLSKGGGYLLASTTQLVKVGDSLDKTSKLEGMLESLAVKKNILAQELKEVEMAEFKLTQELAQAMDDDDDPLGLVTGVAGMALYHADSRDEEVDDDYNNDSTPSRRGKRDKSSPLPPCPSTPTVMTSSSSTSMLTTPDGGGHRAGNAVTPVSVRRERHVEFSDNIPMPSSMDAYLLDGYTEAPPSPSSAFAPLLFCGTYFGNSRPQAPVAGRISRSTPASPCHGAASAPPLVENENNRGATAGVDFRTGFSGHMALASAKTHAPRTSSRSKSRGVRLMSEHMGIGTIRRLPQNGSHNPYKRSRSPNLSNPTW